MFILKRRLLHASNRCVPSDTAFAPATLYPSIAAIAIIRISGSESKHAIEALCPKFNLKEKKLLKYNKDDNNNNTVINKKHPRQLIFTKITHPLTGLILDHGMAVFFKGPNSFTGEDSAELHLHGGPAVVRSVLDALSCVPGCRMAVPGEFTQRAFLNGKLDLMQAEGINELISAQTENQRILALNQTQLNCVLSKRYFNWSKVLVECIARLEALIDFGEDENINTLKVLKIVRQKVSIELINDIKNHLEAEKGCELIRKGIPTVIFGPPNAGKSSLMNYLAKRSVSIVSHRAGTTRDILDVTIEIGGHAILLSDTAGICESFDDIEIQGIDLAIKKVYNCPFRIAVFDLSSQESIGNIPDKMRPFIDKNTIIIGNKIDLISNSSNNNIQSTFYGQPCGFFASVSIKNGIGMDDLILRLSNVLETRFGDKNTIANMPTINSRQRGCLSNCLQHLSQFEAQYDFVLMVENLRAASQQMSELQGRNIELNDVLDVLFREFCIGK